jgi:hypothetical protein
MELIEDRRSEVRDQKSEIRYRRSGMGRRAQSEHR